MRRSRRTTTTTATTTTITANNKKRSRVREQMDGRDVSALRYDSIVEKATKV